MPPLEAPAMHFSAIQWVLMLAVPVLQVLMLALLIKRKLRSTLPIFFNYVVFGLITVCVPLIFLPRVSHLQYFVLYWTIEAVGMMVALAVIYEAFLLILKPYSALVDLGKALFWWATVFLALASVVTAIATGGSEANRICAGILLFQRVVQLMQCGLLLLLLVFESRLGLSWRSHGMSIALGMGAFAALDLSFSIVRQHLPAWGHSLDILYAGMPVVLISIWLLNFYLPQPVRKTVMESPSRLIFQRWNEALLSTPLVSRRGEVIAFSTVESFLPGVERTVERVMARKMMQ
jgi:hypothetical protein